MKYAGILFTYYVIILGGGSRAMMILITQGGWGVQNWPKFDDVICARSLTSNQKLLFRNISNFYQWGQNLFWKQEIEFSKQEME